MAESEHSVKINIEGNSTSAEGAFARVKAAVTSAEKTLLSVRSAVSKLMSAFGTFGLAVQGVTMLVNAFRWLKDKLTETAREIAKLKWDIEMRAAANETARLVGFHEKLAKLMKDELDTLTKQRAVAAIEREGKRDYENGRREAERARQIYEAKTPEEEQALRNRFAEEDERRERAERKAERQRRIRELDDEESVYTSKVKGLRNNNADIDDQLRAERYNLLRAGDNEELAKPIRERIAALESRRTANDNEIASLDKEASFRRREIRALKEQRDYEGPTAGFWIRKTEEKRREEAQAQKKEQEEAKEQERVTRETERTERERIRVENADKTARANELGSFAERLAAQDGVSQNRLSAMGLGSGMEGTSSRVANDVRRLVKLLEDEVAATREIDTKATYGE